MPDNPLLVPSTIVVIPLPEQMLWVEGAAVVTGLGFTVISTVNIEPEQLFADGVTVYLITPAVELLLVNV